MPTSPDTRPARGQLLHAARRLLAGLTCTEQPYGGPVAVAVVAPELGIAPECGTELRVIPLPGADGLPTHEPGGGTAAAALAGVPLAELARVLLSPNERTLLATLAEHGPCAASKVADEVKARVRKSAFWELWSNLQQRGLIDQDDDNLYRVGPAWVREIV